MNGAKAIEIQKKMLACVMRQNTPKCGRQCKSCDLLMGKLEVQEALSTSITAMEYLKARQEATKK